MNGSANLVMVGLFVFGLVYDQIVGVMEARGHADGYTAYLVVFGVLVTIGGIGLMDELTANLINAGVLALVAFACSGFPMTFGATWRYMRAREHARKAARDIYGKA